MNSLSLIFFFCLVLCCSCFNLKNLSKKGADPQNPCQLPTQFQSNFYMIQLNESQCATEAIFAEMFFDSIGQNFRVDSNVNDTTTSVWEFFDQGIGYVYEYSSKTCVSFKVSGGLPNPIIPAGSVYEGEFLIGNQAIDAWLTEPSNQEDPIEVFLVTNPTCYAVSLISISQESGTTQFTEDFFDFIPDLPPFIFELPDSCNGARIAKSMPALSSSVVLPKLFAPK